MGNEGSAMAKVSYIGEQVIQEVMNRSFFPAILQQIGAPNRCTAAEDINEAETYMCCQIDRASRPNAKITFKIAVMVAVAISILSLMAGMRIYRFACTLKQMVYHHVSIQVNNEQNNPRASILPPRVRDCRLRRLPPTNEMRETVINIEDDRGEAKRN